jgi:hypothetical protein
MVGVCVEMLTLCQRVFSKLVEGEWFAVVEEEDDPSRAASLVPEVFE